MYSARRGLQAAIVVLDGGHISEMGKPAELLQKGGLYAHLVALQQGV